MTTTTINVTDMHCASCSGKIIAALSRRERIRAVKVNPLKRDVFVTHDAELAPQDILQHIAQLGFSPAILSVFDQTDSRDSKLLKRLGVAGICMMQVMMLQIALYAGAFQDMAVSLQHLMGYVALLFAIPVVTYSAVPFFVNGLGGILRQGINMDTPIALAISIAFAVSLMHLMQGSGEVYFDSVTMFTFLLLGARYLDQTLRSKLHLEDELLAHLPRFATRHNPADQTHEQVSLADVRAGQTIWVGEGEMVPVDGLLQTPSARIDGSLLTGEVDARTLHSGDPVYAGTLNQGPGFLVVASGPSSASRIAEINAIANQAGARKSESEGLADQVARIFIPAIITIAVATFAFWMYQDASQAIAATLAVLVISCPCALSLAAPAVWVAATTRLRRLGLLVRNSQALERLVKVRHVFFDKTGTLNQPTPQIRTTRLVGDQDEQTCLSVAIALQRYAAHPLAQAFKTRQPAVSLEVENIAVVRGAGVQGMIAGCEARIGRADFCGFSVTDETASGKYVYLSIAGRPAAVFVLDTPLRPDAGDTVRALQDAGLTVSLLSGDHQANCAQTAQQLGIEYSNDATPESKREQILAQADCLFVGDGLNDLPALSAASVSAATVETVDLVKSKADVLLMTSRLGSLLDLFAVAHRARRVTAQNYAWAILYNVIAIPCAAAGLASPLIAAVGMSASSLLVMLNACRLLRTQGG